MVDNTEALNGEAPKKERSSLKLFFIVLILFILAGMAVAGYFFVFMPKSMESGNDMQARKALVSKQAQAKVTSMSVGGEFSDPMGPIKQLDFFIVNLTDDKGTRYLKVVMQLEMSKDSLVTEIDEKMPQIRDEIILMFSSKSFDDVATIAGKRALKHSVISGINRYLSTGQVKRVYFTEFVVQ